MRFVALSDTHGFHHQLKIPDGDVLLFAGDMCGPGNLREVENFGDWLRTLPHTLKIVIAGNHDWPFERDLKSAREALGSDIIYLQDESYSVDSHKIYGSPWQPEFGNWAFNLPRGSALQEVWAKIPDDTDILLTHGPPYGKLDRTYDRRQVGCDHLRGRLTELPQLKAHLFGHIHESYGKLDQAGCLYLNGSICDISQRFAINLPWVFDL